MDFSWVKELADKSNQKEQMRQLEDRRQKEGERLVALATPPFVEKLHLLLSTCAEEFNKYIVYPHLKITITKLAKRTRGTINPEDPDLSYPDDSSFFSFGRQEWTYGIRGSRGTVEFIELPSDGGAMAYGIEESGASPSHKLTAEVDEKSHQIVWKYGESHLQGQDIVALCKDYIRQFIERTN